MAVIPKRRIARLGPRSSGLSMTPEEFDRLPESAWTEGYRYELIRGVLVVTPPPGNAKIDPNQDLGYLLWCYSNEDPRGRVIDKSLPGQTIHATQNRRRCDRAVWIGLGRVPELESDVPAIVVEFVSRSRRDHQRDYMEKLAEYLAIGVREYWIIDRFRRIMTVHRPGLDGAASLVVGEAETYRTDLLPGFDLPLARLLAKADDWPPRKKRNPPRKAPEGDPR